MDRKDWAEVKRIGLEISQRKSLELKENQDEVPSKRKGGEEPSVSNDSDE